MMLNQDFKSVGNVFLLALLVEFSSLVMAVRLQTGVNSYSSPVKSVLVPIHFESTRGDVGICLKQSGEANNEKTSKSIVILGSKVGELSESKAIPKVIAKTICTNWKPTLMAVTIDPRRIDPLTERPILMRKRKPTSLDLKTLDTKGYIIPQATSDLYKDNNQKKGPFQVLRNLRNSREARFAGIMNSIHNVLAPSKEMALEELWSPRMLEDTSLGESNGKNKKDQEYFLYHHVYGGEVPEGIDDFLEVAREIKSPVLLADRDCVLNKDYVQKALEITKEFELKVAELDVHRINLEDAVGSDRKSAEMFKILLALGDIQTTNLARESMKKHAPEVYKSLIEDRAQFITESLLARNESKIFLLAPQYLLPTIQANLLGTGYECDTQLTEHCVKNLLENQYARLSSDSYGISEGGELTTTAPFDRQSTMQANHGEILSPVIKGLEDVIIGEDLTRLIRWLARMANIVIPYHPNSRSNSGKYSTYEFDDGEDEDDNEDDSQQREEENRVKKTEALFQKVEIYQRSHSWLKDNNLKGKRGDYEPIRN